MRPIYIANSQCHVWSREIAELAKDNLYETGTEKEILYVEMLESREISISTRFYDFNYCDTGRLFLQDLIILLCYIYIYIIILLPARPLNDPPFEYRSFYEL